MLRLALILFGGHALAVRWKIFFVVGIVAMLLGAAVWLDLADGVADIAVWLIGAIVLIEGGVALTVGATHAAARRRFELWRGAAMIVFACLILDFPWNNSIATWVLVAGAFLFDGAIRILSSLLIRYAYWRRACLIGIGTLGMAALLIFDWPVPHSMNVSFCVGLGLLVGGFLMGRGAWQLRRLPADVRLAALALYRDSQLPSMAQPAATPAEAVSTAGKQEMIVHVWTAVDGTEQPVRLPIIERYIAAVSRKGAVSTGHAALECAPDIYISHHPRDVMTIGTDDFLDKVRAIDANDVAGKWFPSYQEEVIAECPSSYRIRFRVFNYAYLQAFWQSYRGDTTYNLTRRNCSVAVTRAIDAAVEGVFADKPFWPTLLRLALHSDMWLAGRARARAESMAWTPGLALDYAMAVRRITHPRRGLHLRSAWRLPRMRIKRQRTSL